MTVYQSIRTTLVDCPEGRLRDVDLDWASCLGAMIKETGQKTPIDVVATGKRYRLVAGAHRLAAVKLIKRREIDARVLDLKDGENAEALRLHEILDNLCRRNFNALERCEALFELKRIYEALHPQTRNGGDRRSQAARTKRDNQNEIFAFCSSATESTGLSRRSIELAVAIFKGLSPETRERLRGSFIAEKQADLKALSGASPDHQKKALDLIFAEPPEAASVADALLLAEGKFMPSDTDRLFKSVSTGIAKLTRAGRASLFRIHRAEIIDLALKEGWLDAQDAA